MVENNKISAEAWIKAGKILEEIDNKPPSCEKMIFTGGTGFSDEAVVKAFAHTSHLVITRDGSKWRHGVRVEE